MKIALDYDGTYTLDPSFWDAFIFNARQSGHLVYIVTGRKPTEPVGHDHLEPWTYYTSGKPKRQYMQYYNELMDVWIDDRPELIGRTIEFE